MLLFGIDYDHSKELVNEYMESGTDIIITNL